MTAMTHTDEPPTHTGEPGIPADTLSFLAWRRAEPALAGFTYFENLRGLPVLDRHVRWPDPGAHCGRAGMIEADRTNNVAEELYLSCSPGDARRPRPGARAAHRLHLRVGYAARTRRARLPRPGRERKRASGTPGRHPDGAHVGEIVRRSLVRSPQSPWWPRVFALVARAKTAVIGFRQSLAGRKRYRAPRLAPCSSRRGDRGLLGRPRTREKAFAAACRARGILPQAARRQAALFEARRQAYVDELAVLSAALDFAKADLCKEEDEEQ